MSRRNSKVHSNRFQPTLVRKLGEGGFGETFLTRTSSGLKTLKVFKDNGSKELEVLKKIMVKCVAKNLLCYDSVYKQEDKIYLSTEYLSNGDLFDYYKTVSKKKIDYNYEIKNFRKFIAQLCQAVDFIHSVGVVHYDIKPENVMLDGRKNIKLIDFGMAQIRNGDTVTSPRGYTDGYVPQDIIVTGNLLPFRYAVWFDAYAVLRTFLHDYHISPYHIITKGMPEKLVTDLQGILEVLSTPGYQPKVIQKLLRVARD